MASFENSGAENHSAALKQENHFGLGEEEWEKKQRFLSGAFSRRGGLG
jgi:hypothetical protein